MFALRAPLPETASSRDRLLAGALTVFSQNGLHGATTKAIAEEAKVNEVTLFRLFGTKDRLLADLLSSMVAAALQGGALESNVAQWRDADLRTNLTHFAEQYYGLLAESEAFIRAMIGEAHRFPEHSRKILHEAGRPLHAWFVAQLGAARSAGRVRQGLDLGLAAQAFMDTLFSSMLRYTAGCCDADTPQQFITTFVDVFATGLAVPHASAPTP